MEPEQEAICSAEHFYRTCCENCWSSYECFNTDWRVGLACPNCDFLFVPRRKNADDVADALCHCTLRVWCDGCCLDNGRPTARGGIGVYVSPRLMLSERLMGVQTNQRAEIVAAIRGVEYVMASEAELNGKQLLVITDSRYVVDAMTDWVWKWRDNGWRNNRGEPVTNATDFQRLDLLLCALEERGVTVMLRHISRHLNAKADELAKRGARMD